MVTVVSIPLIAFLASIGALDIGRWHVYLDTRASVRPASFYGQVVDPQGMPLEGVEVRMSVITADWRYIFCSNSVSREQWFTFRTDEHGGFSFAGRHGIWIFLHGMHKEGYMFDRRNREYGAKMYSLSRAKPQDTYVPDPANPVVLILRPATEKNLATMDRVDRQDFERRRCEAARGE